MAIRRRKLEHLIIEHVHQRDVIRELINKKVASSKSFDWLCQMRFYFDPKVTNVIRQISIQMANSKFLYGFEYLGVQDKLVQRCMLKKKYP
jgi:dynein heavy chain 1, cytosolic